MIGMAPQSDEGRQIGYVDNLEYLLDELSRLDLLIHLRLLKKQNRQSAHPLESFKGLVLLEEEILQLVTGAANTITDESPDVTNDIPNDTTNDAQAGMLAETLERFEARIANRRAKGLVDGTEVLLARLSQLFSLTRFDEDCLLFCL